MTIESSARAYVSTAEIRDIYGSARARLMGAASAPKAVQPTPAQPKPVRPSLSAYPAVLDIVDAICGEIALSRDQLLTDIQSDVAVDARKIAAALVVRRLPVTCAAAAEYFGIPVECIATALQRIDLTLVARAIPRNADLGQTVRLVVADWQLHDDLKPGIPDIKRAVCAEFGITRPNIDSKRRDGPLVAPRHFAMALAKRLTGRSLPFIARHFGGRDHTTVLYAVRKMRPVIEAIEPSLAEPATLEAWVRAGRLQLEELAKQARQMKETTNRSDEAAGECA